MGERWNEFADVTQKDETWSMGTPHALRGLKDR